MVRVSALNSRRPAHAANNNGVQKNSSSPLPRSSLISSRSHRSPSHSNGSGSSSILSRQSLLILGLGILFGYVLLPILLVEFDVESVLSEIQQMDRSKSADGFASKSAPLRTNKNPYPGISVAGSTSTLRPPRTLESSGSTLTSAINGNAHNNDMNEVQQRLVEENRALSSQSLPTTTTPYIMKTAQLPDHKRKKILVTGGAGFVGSHLVDKLMQQGHEVIVADNFFTGQKKNIAHWLHHPNFK